MRGADAGGLGGGGGVEELPPHARGRHDALLQADREEGATPACAGPTTDRVIPAVTTRSYPRMRGADPS